MECFVSQMLEGFHVWLMEFQCGDIFPNGAKLIGRRDKRQQSNSHLPLYLCTYILTNVWHAISDGWMTGLAPFWSQITNVSLVYHVKFSYSFFFFMAYKIFYYHQCHAAAVVSLETFSRFEFAELCVLLCHLRRHCQYSRCYLSMEYFDGMYKTDALWDVSSMDIISQIALKVYIGWTVNYT